MCKCAGISWLYERLGLKIDRDMYKILDLAGVMKHSSVRFDERYFVLWYPVMYSPAYNITFLLTGDDEDEDYYD